MLRTKQTLSDLSLLKSTLKYFKLFYIAQSLSYVSCFKCLPFNLLYFFCSFNIRWINVENLLNFNNDIVILKDSLKLEINIKENMNLDLNDFEHLEQSNLWPLFSKQLQKFSKVLRSLQNFTILLIILIHNANWYFRLVIRFCTSGTGR